MKKIIFFIIVGLFLVTNIFSAYAWDYFQSVSAKKIIVARNNLKKEGKFKNLYK